MNKWIKLLLVVALAIPSVCFAAGTADIVKALDASRDASRAMIMEKDKSAYDARVEAVKKSSDEVDAAITAVLADASTPAEVKTKLIELKSIWEESKKTRDMDIIPAVLAGDNAKAKQVAKNVQADRFKQMQNLLK